MLEAWRRSGVAQDQLEAELLTWNRLRPAASTGRMPDDELSGGPGHLSHGLADRGQLRPHHGSDGRIIEVQGTAEKTPFSQEEFLNLMALARKGVGRLVDLQKMAVS